MGRKDRKTKGGHIAKICLLTLAGLPVLALAGCLLFGAVTNYRPPDVLPLTPENRGQAPPLEKQTPYRMVSWDIGYAGQDRGQKLWWEGGGLGHATQTDVERNLLEITSFLRTGRYDFILLQQVDVNAARSYGVDQAAFLAAQFAAFENVFAYDFKVKWTPFTNRFGRVESGQQILTMASAEKAERRRLPNGEGFLENIFGYDRCLTILRFAVAGGGELVLLNGKLPAIETGERQKKWLAELKEALAGERAAGNYVIWAGGWGVEIPWEDFAPDGFTWITGGDNPTARSLNRPYVYGENTLSIQDGFLVTDTVGMEWAQTAGLEFQNAAHNPVEWQFILT